MKNLLMPLFICISTGLAHAMHDPEFIAKQLAMVKNQRQRPDEVAVPMFGSDVVKIDKASATDVILSTDGLGGCLATVLSVQYDDGSSCNGITHYPRSHKGIQSTKFLQQMKECATKNNIKAVRAFHIVPGDWKRDDNGVFTKFEPQEHAELESLFNWHSRNLPSNAEKSFETISYSESMDDRNYYFPDIELHLNKNSTSLTCNDRCPLFDQKRWHH
jgi:hypothetical protein